MTQNLRTMSCAALLAGFDVTDARVLAVNGQPVQSQPPSQASQQPLQAGPSPAPDAPKASNIPSPQAAYIILGEAICNPHHTVRITLSVPLLKRFQGPLCID